ncbi:MAG: recombination regulator RecX [Burkholderiaceae bacterium]|nr:recombination regulator RecX [Burkholderiaceae bacterium]MCD8537487.1 recombination regulator RecX [Burkholderiaceae bacterium]MCD8564176.1 recombination regulator RecX [Burkholderiaceae bacterium]
MRQKSKPEEFEPLPAAQLKAKAVRWLAAREYTRTELARKLGPYADTPEDVETVLDDLERGGWQSDARFVQSFQRVKSGKQGSALIAQGLRQKGVDPDLIARTLDQLKDTELERARAVWDKKFGKVGVSRDPKEKARQARFLASRGFGGDVIRRVVGGEVEQD